jgi:Bacterial Ig domain
MRLSWTRSWVACALFGVTIGVALPLVASSGPSGADTPSSIILPAANATVSGTHVVLDALEPSGTTQVTFVAFDGGLQYDIGAATPSIYGWYALWDSTTVPDGTYDLLAIGGPGASITITVNNAPIPPTVNLVVPSGGATVSGTTYLDAIATPGSDGVAATSMDFFLLGGPDCQQVPGCQLGTGTPTLYGWLSAWNTHSWPNGTYSLYAASFSSNGLLASSGLTSAVTVDNTPPTVVLPASSATVSGTQWLDCVSPAGTSQVQFWLSGGALSSPQLLGSATPTPYGWLYDWTTSGVSDGGYSLYCSATYLNDGTGQGPSIPVTVAN